MSFIEKEDNKVSVRNGSVMSSVLTNRKYLPTDMRCCCWNCPAVNGKFKFSVKYGGNANWRQKKGKTLWDYEQIGMWRLDTTDGFSFFASVLHNQTTARSH